MAAPKILKGELVNPGSGPQQCAECREFLQAGDRITHTLDMRRLWHTKCFEASLTPLADWAKTTKP